MLESSFTENFLATHLAEPCAQTNSVVYIWRMIGLGSTTHGL